MKPTVLIVDDSDLNLKILSLLLRNDYQVVCAASGEECLEKLPQCEADLVLLDIMMPGLDGYETCTRIKADPAARWLPVILVSAKASTEERLLGYRAGADDYVVKPFDHDELMAKVRVQLRLRQAQQDLLAANSQIRQFNAELECLVDQRSEEVVGTRDVAIFALAKLAESRDPETGEHLERMRNYSRILADELRQRGPYRDMVDEEFVHNIYQSSPLHDVGKVGVPDAVLLKPGRLTGDEFEIMKLHTVIGAQALEQTVEHHQCGGFLTMAIEIARHHHERFDGRGYPAGLSGTAIPLSARIVALADVFDALTSPRVYKAAFDESLAREMIEEQSGKQFDPAVVEAFRSRYDDFLEYLRAHPPAEDADRQSLCNLAVD
jgi:putative two-component system response regulator